MAEERLQITLEADVSGATAQIDKFSSALGKTVPAAAAKASSGIDKVGKSVANANPALVNFGRVIQDAPFGLIGIANNIDPLIESFGRLKQSTGSTGGALKALGGALLGPAGIGIAISAVTSALITFGPAISDAISGISKFEKALKEAGAAGNEAFKKAQIEFALLVQNANNSTISINQQEEAFKKANSALSNYGIEIESLSAFQKQGAVIGDIYAKIKQNEAKANALAAASAAQYAAGIAAVNFAQEKGTKLVTGGFFEKLLFFANPGNIAALGKATDQVTNQGKAQNNLDNAVSAVNRENQKLIGDLEKLDGIAKKGSAKELAKAQTATANATKKSATATKELTDAEKENASFLAQDIPKRSSNITLLKNSKEEIDKTTEALKKQNEQKRIEKANSKFGAGLPPAQLRAFDPTYLQKSKEAADLVKAELTETELIANKTAVAMGFLGGAVDAVFNALASGENAFEALGGFVKQLTIDIAKAIVKALILRAITSAIGGGGGGFATSLVGGAISSVLGSKAAGGPVVAGGGYIVGENGPEKFYPTSPGMITPNDVGGGAGGQFEFVISGNTLRTINRRADTSFGRLNG